MGYKQMDQNMTFAEIDLMTSMEHNRSLKMMEKINQIIDWSEIEVVLLKHYAVGTPMQTFMDGKQLFAQKNLNDLVAA